MAAIILPHRWWQQPDAPVRVNWAHPIARGLIVAWSGAQPTFNAATESLVTLKNGIGLGDMPGKSLRFEGTAGSTTCHYVSIPWTFGKVAAGGGIALVRVYHGQASVGQ